VGVRVPPFAPITSGLFSSCLLRCAQNCAHLTTLQRRAQQLPPADGVALCDGYGAVPSDPRKRESRLPGSRQEAYGGGAEADRQRCRQGALGKERELYAIRVGPVASQPAKTRSGRAATSRKGPWQNIAGRFSLSNRGKIRRILNMKRTLMLIAFAVLIVTLSISTPNLAAQAAQPEAQPHMQAALERLREAQRELEAATHDKGGHRSRAVSLVKQAIVQVNQGISYDSTHKEGNERAKPRPK
jgi:hypothetical protein